MLVYTYVYLCRHGGTDKDYEDSLDKLFNQHPPPPDAEEGHVGNRASRRGEHSSGAPSPGSVTGTVIRFPSSNSSPEYWLDRLDKEDTSYVEDMSVVDLAIPTVWACYLLLLHSSCYPDCILFLP